MEKIETAVEPRFQEHFVGAMGIPHATDPYPRLGRRGRPAGAQAPTAPATRARVRAADTTTSERSTDMSDDAPTGRRTGGRAGRAAARAAAAAERVPVHHAHAARRSRC